MAPPCRGRRRTASTACSSTRLARRSTASTGRKRMPCAGALRGGAPGPQVKDAQERWLADKRQYAPWHYKREAMLTSPSGELCIPPPFIKEQLREIPLDYTWVEGVSDKWLALGESQPDSLPSLSWRDRLPACRGAGSPRVLGRSALISGVKPWHGEEERAC